MTEQAVSPAKTEDDTVAERGRPLLRVLVVLGVVAVLVGAATVAALRFDLVGRLLVRDATAGARVGDCLAPLPDVAAGAERRSAEARVVSCSSPDAAYDVVGRVAGLTGAEARQGRRCEPFVTAGTSYYTYSSAPAGGKGYLLCLAPRS